jgi:hypothetical protein
MVKGTNHVFFDVSNTNFTITAGSTDTIAPTAPTLAAGNNSNYNKPILVWCKDNVAVIGYDVYKMVLYWDQRLLQAMLFLV